MSLRFSASFPSRAAASRAVRLLRLRGVSAQLCTRGAPMRPPHPDGFDASGFYTGAPAVTALRALPLLPGEPAVPARCALEISAEPQDAGAVRAIVCRCGGALCG